MDLINDPDRKLSKVSRRNEQGFLISNNDSADFGKEGFSQRIRPNRSLIAYIVKLWIMIFALYYFGESFLWSSMSKNSSLAQFSNVVALNDSYSLKVIVHDLDDKLAEDGFSADQLVYGQESVFSNFTVLSRRLLRRYDRYRIEVIASFNSTVTNKTENTSCFMEIAYKSPVDALGNNSTESSSEPDPKQPQRERATLRKTLRIQMIHDENTYDFTESPLLSYVYHKNKIYANQTNATTFYYRPRLECSHFWAQDSDIMSFDLLPEDESVPIFVDLQSTKINRHIWGLKLRLLEKTVEDWNIDPKWLQSVKAVIANNNSDLIMLLAFICFCKLAISLTVIAMAKYTTLGDMAEATWSAKRCVLRVISWSSIVIYLVTSRTSLALIAIAGYQLAEACFLVIKKGFSSQKKNSLVTENNFFDYLMFPIIAVSIAYAISAYTRSPSSIMTLEIIQPLIWIAYGLEAVSLAAPISLHQKRRSIRVFARACPFYEFFTAVADDLFVFLAGGPMPHLIFAFANDLVFGLYMIQMIVFRKGKCSLIDENDTENGISVVDNLKQKQQ